MLVDTDRCGVGTVGRGPRDKQTLAARVWTVTIRRGNERGVGMSKGTALWALTYVCPRFCAQPWLEGIPQQEESRLTWGSEFPTSILELSPW